MSIDVRSLPAPYVNDPNKFVTDFMQYDSYSGADIQAVILLPNEKDPLVLGELQTISVSTHRENTPVRVLGRTNPCGFVKGPRTIAGSMIFTTFNHYAFYRLKEFQYMIAEHNLFTLSDMLPPFDIVLSFSNESGSFSKMKIYGCTIVDEGTTMSIDDLITEATYTYMASGIQPLTAYVPQGYRGNRLHNGSRISFGV